jgi:thiamine biosynthesis lipoprotein
VKVSPELQDVLSRSLELSRKSEGAFDVSVGPLTRLWRRARRRQQLPTEERLADARERVGYQWIHLDEAAGTVTLLKPRMELDLGGSATGYAADEALRVLARHGIDRALVDASGDIAVGDPPPGKRGWSIVVAPLSVPGTPTRRILLANAAITTAGDASQHVVIDGRRYSHIVDPRTGLGLSDQIAVGVIAPDCLTADSLDTAVSVMGVKAGLRLVEDTPGAAAIFMRPVDGGFEVVESRRFAGHETSEAK